MKKWAFPIALAMALLGCASSNNTAGLKIDGASQSVVFGDNVLAGNISIEDIATAKVDGRARGVVRIANQTKGNQHLQYRFYWYDDQGLEVNNKLSPWRQIIVRGSEEVSISEVSINPNGRQFRVQIRELDD